MKKILISNIGSRNISYSGQMEGIDLLGSNAPFKESTKLLLDNYESEKQYISPQILPALIDLEITDLSTIYLFASDSPEGERDNQDTLYEALILKKLLEERYPSVEVIPVNVHERVVDINNLMVFYRNFFNANEAIFKEANIIVCDAGGTSQQKTALKIVVEYLLPINQFRFYNIVLKNHKSVPEQIESLEYRRVIDEQQILRLIEHYDYAGALSLYQVRRGSKTDSISALLKLGAALFTNHAQSAISIAQAMPKANKQEALIKELAGAQYFAAANNEWNELFTRDVIFKLGLILEIARSYHKISDWGNTILYHHIFQERLLGEVLGEYFSPNDLHKDWEKIKKNISAGKYLDGVDQIGERSLTDIHSPNLPVLREMAVMLNKPQLTNIVTSISNDHQKQFSSLRNKYAHEGRTIEKRNVQFLFPLFQTWQNLFMLPGTSVFDRLNEVINTVIRK